MAGGGIPPLRFDNGGSTSDPYNNPSLYPDLWNTWGSSAQDTYDRVIRLLTSPEYKDWYNSLAAPTQAYAVPYYSNPNDPDLLYRAQQERQNWEAFSGNNPWEQPSTGGGGTGTGTGGWGTGGGGTGTGGWGTGGGGTGTGGGGTGTGGGGTGTGGGGTGTGGGGTGTGGGGTGTGGGGTGTGGGGTGTGGGNWGGGGGQTNPYTPPPGYSPPDFPNLAFGYPWVPEELKALRAAIGLVPGGGGMPTEPPAVSTEEAEAKTGGIMSLMSRSR